MAQNRFTRNISANALQLIINQVFGLAIFYALSQGVAKDIFGQINWALAVLLTVFGVLGFGMDQVLVKKIASGADRASVFSAYLFHVFISGGVFYGLLLLSYLLWPHSFSQQSFLLFIGAGKLMIFFSTPFKQLAAGLEKFNRLFWMAIVSNVIRGSALLLLLILHRVSINFVLIIFIAGDLAELTVSAIIAMPLLRTANKIVRDKKVWLLLVKESIPQAGVVVFTAVMARFDWILIGLLISGSRLAEYSFAWKVFEVSTLPLLILAPVMVPLFTRIREKPGSMARLSFFLEWQIIIASFAALLLAVCWTPVIDLITNGKYGAVNTNTVFLLALSMPVLYFNNYLWTINFAAGKLKMIFLIMVVSFAVNIISCSILIPLYKNEGAALANLLTVLTQLILYSLKTPAFIPWERRYFLLLWPVLAFVTVFSTEKYIPGKITGIAVSGVVFLIAVFLSRRLRLEDKKTLQSLYQ